MTLYSAKFDEARFDSSKFNVQYSSKTINASIEVTSFDIITFTLYIDQERPIDIYIDEVVSNDVYIDQVKEIEVEL